MNGRLALYLLAACSLNAHVVFVKGFVSITTLHQSTTPQKTPQIRLQNNNNNNNNGNFDITKSQFDLYSLRTIRGDALIRYNTLNQSEPLRINLYLLTTLSLLSYPSLSDAVIGEPATLPSTLLAIAGATFSGYRFIREAKRRIRKLNRMEKELNAECLTVQIPNGAFADRPYGKTKFELKALRGKRRIVAVCGSASQLKEALVPFRTLRRRFVQASVLVVAVPNDRSSAEDWGIDGKEIQSVPYLAQAGNSEEWVDYFESLVGGGSDDDGGGGDGGSGGRRAMDGQIAWFGLSNSGKSFGSGFGDALRPIEILGQSLRPLECLDENDKDYTGGGGSDTASSDNIRSILASQKQFYHALTTGDRAGMTAVYSTVSSDELDQTGDAYIEPWTKCLENDNRPSQMKTSGSDVLVVSETEAYSTSIEFPLVEGATAPDATLLAVQKWIRDTRDEEWKLQLHQTIPWSTDTRAGATLRCDCRGCTALTREPVSQYNFRGMID